MLETIRVFALEKLPRLRREDDAASAARRSGCSRSPLRASSAWTMTRAAHGSCSSERDDLRAALDWATAADPRVALELVVAL